jgi:hypothetical protein
VADHDTAAFALKHGNANRLPPALGVTGAPAVHGAVGGPPGGWGHCLAAHADLFSGSLADREFVAFWLREGRVQAGMAVNTWDRMGELSALIRSGDRISGAALGRFAA